MLFMRRILPFAVPFVVGALVLVGLGLAIVGRGGALPSPSPSSSVSPSATVAPETDGDSTEMADGRQSVRFVVDGWTMRTLGRTALKVTDAKGAPARLEFSPITQLEYERVLQRAPVALVGPLSRVLPLSPELSCQADGCVLDGEPVPFDWVEDPAQVPGLGPALSSWKVSSLLWTATARVNGKFGPVTVEADGWSPASYSVFVSEPQDGAAGETGESASQPDGPGAGSEPDQSQPLDDPAAGSTGFGVGVLPLAGGLGVLFVPQPAWLGSDPSLGFVDAFDTTPPTSEQVGDTPVLFLQGLSNASKDAARLSPAALTYMTAASTGCGTGVLCTPSAIDVQFVSKPVTESFEVCFDGKPSVRVLVTDAVWSAVFPHPTHQFGVWSTTSELDVFGSGFLVRGVPGLTPVGEPVDVRTISAAYFGVDSTKSIALERFVGVTAQKGVDEDFALDRADWLASQLSGRDSVCGS